MPPSALLPPYFDSPTHYSLIQSILRMEHGAPLAWPAQGYYHLGYHLILSLPAAWSGGDLARLMLLFGSLTLAALPLPVYALILIITRSRPAALTGAALAAFGWSMPAHALDWGKYPGLLSLLALQFTLGAALLGRAGLQPASPTPAALAAGERAVRSFPPRIGSGGSWFTLTALTGEIIHTRFALLLGAAGIGWLLARLKPRLLAPLAIAVLALEGFLLLRDPLLRAALEPYVNGVGLLVCVLAVLALATHPREGFAALLGLAVLIGMMFVPLPLYTALLDRPLVQMTLWLPLALLGGIGAARLPRWHAAFLVPVLLLHALATQSFSPAPCCELAGADDVAALAWMADNLPAEARVGIAVTDVSLSASGTLVDTPVDGGAWVSPLTGRAAIPLPHDLNFQDPETHAFLCAEGITHLYVGGKDSSFALPTLDFPTSGYTQALTLPYAQVIAVVSCSPTPMCCR